MSENRKRKSHDHILSKEVQNSAKKVRKAITLEVKNEILNQHNSGLKVNELAHKFKLSHSTVSTILKDKEKYLKEIKNARSLQSTVIRKRDGLILEVERVLIVWMNYQTQTVHVPLNQATISAQALSIFETLKKQHGETAKNETFNASKGWFDRFRKRAGWHNIRVQGEAASSNTQATEQFPEKLTKIIQEEGYSPKQIFNVDETGLFWKRMPSRTYIAREEKCMSGFKDSKDRLTLLLGSNAAGDCKLKPLLIYHTENPRLFEGFDKTLPVIWKSNPRAWMTAMIFKDWFVHHFVPEIKKYCADNNLPFKILLLMDSAPSHPAILQHHNPNIRIIFLPPNTTSVLQPMNQGVITFFKAYYLRRTFEKLVEAVDKKDGPTIREIWKKFSILDCVEIIKYSWNDVTVSDLKGVWKKLCPQFILDSESIDVSIKRVTEAVVNIANQLSLEVTSEDVIELLNAHEESPSNEDLIEMVEQGTINKEKGRDEVVVTSRAFIAPRLSEAFEHIESALKIFEEDDPNFDRSSKVIAAIRKEYACYTEIYKERKKASSVQKSLDSVFLKSVNTQSNVARESSESVPSTTINK